MTLSTELSLMQQQLHIPSKLQAKALNAARSLADNTDGDTQADARKAREAANKFESLLIHNMLKSMRKTTMTENKSNDRAIYDDMLDEKLADTMMEAGGIGIADQIVEQIQQQQGKALQTSTDNTDIQNLRELATHIRARGSEESGQATADARSRTALPLEQSRRLQFATNMWNSTEPHALSEAQLSFVQPLIPDARRTAQKLGTSPSAILAIAALETGWGRSTIKDEQGNDSHNLFGIKATSADNRYATTLTTEYIEGTPQKLRARFKTFDSSADAVEGFADFIRDNPRYSKALQHAQDPERFLFELQAAGYATDPRYAEKAISIMRQIAGNQIPL